MYKNTKLERRRFSRAVAAISLRLLAVAAFMGILIVPSAFGSDFSDTWVDDSNPDAASIVGTGVTDGDYSADAIDVETTLRSPNGRTVTGDAVGVFSARAEVTLSWDWNDFGEFSIQSVHQPYCSDGAWGADGILINHYYSGGMLHWWNLSGYSRCLSSRLTSISIPAGVSFSCYELIGYSRVNDRVIGAYNVISPCNATCKACTASYRFSNVRGASFEPPRSLSVAEPYLGRGSRKICSHIASPLPVDSCGGCADVYLPPLPFLF